MGNIFFNKKGTYDADTHGVKDQALYDQYLADDSKLEDLSGKTVAITGTSINSLGYYCAQAVIHKHAKRLLLLNRDSESAKKGYEGLLEVQKEAKSPTQIDVVNCDLQDFNSVKECGSKVNSMCSNDGLDILICNAGVMAMKDIRTKDGFDVQMQTNQLSHFLLTSIVFPSIVKAAEKRGDARIVTHSSSSRNAPGVDLEEKYFQQCEPGTLGGDYYSAFAQGFGYEGDWYRYHQTKLANACFSMMLHDKLKASSNETIKTKIQSNTADPGGATTNLQSTSDGMPQWMIDIVTKFSVAQSAADGSLPLCMSAFGKDVKSGTFFYPKGVSKGAPVTIIEDGKAVKKGNEKLVLSEDNKANVWKWCEEALNIKFDI